MPNNIVYVDLISGTDEASKTITGATKANPCVITCNAHGYSNGDQVLIWNVAGMTQLNNNRYTIGNVTLNTFELTGINSTGYSTYSSGGNTNRRGTNTTPFLTVNAGVAIGTLAPDCRVAKTTSYASVSSTFGWTAKSVTVTTSSDTRASIAVGDYIGKTTAQGNGAEETFYRVASITATTITLDFKYGGATGSEASCNKLVIATTGVSNTSAITLSTTSTLLSGGWNLLTQTQDGETWFKGNFSRGYGAYCINTGAVVNISKINCVDGSYGIYAANASAITNCTIHGYAMGVQVSTGFTMDSCCVSHYVTYGGIYGPFYSLTNCVFLGYMGINANGAGAIVSNCKFISISYIGYLIAASPTKVNNCSFRNCAVGINALSNSVIDTCTFDTCPTAINSPTATSGVLVTNCSFSNCANYGVNPGYAHGWVFNNCSFTNVGTCINMDNLSGDFYLYGCSFITPSVYALTKVATSGTYFCYGCTIDGASLAKAYNSVASYYVNKQYVFQNSFGKTGTVWGNGSVMRDDTNYRTSAPCVAIGWVSSSTLSQLDIKVVSSWAKSGVTRTYTMWIKSSSGSWSGILTPKWKLGGVIIKTESNITSLTTSYVQYSWTCDSSLITSDGELSFELAPNSNGYAIYIDDFSVQ